ncbi:MAG TPA: diacylglycerol kinase family protein [Anaerolineales bacterium]|nr:diacylglycerol kinase family protein [Anaerolineales bacterium]
MRSAVIVYNPAAGRFPVKPFIKSAVEELESTGWRVDVEATRSGTHTVDLARQAAAEKKDAVFAVGGDGTIGNVVNGLIDSDTALGVLPAGTANVWSMELGLSPFAWTRPWVLRQNASLLANAPVHYIDVGMCNEFSFMMWAGIGLDALTIQSIEPRIRLEKFFAMPEYTARTIWKAATWNGIHLRLWADGEEVEGQYILAVATNIRHYLGGLSKLSPDAYLDDGLLDMWLFSGSHLGDALRHAYDMWRGNHFNSDMARRITFQSLRIEAESPYWIQTDGEPRGSTQRTEIRVRSRALKMLMPPRGMSLLKNASLKEVHEYSPVA